MNWILSIVFWAVMFLEFEFLGMAANTFMQTKTGIVRNWITGYFAYFLCALPMGIVCQLVRISWAVFFIIQTLLLVLLNLAAFYYLKRKGKLEKFKEGLVSFFFGGWKHALKNNWFGMVFIAAAMFLLISTQQGVLWTNYDDYFYLGKMVNLQGADVLFMENYESGAPLTSIPVELARFFNTYELTYSWTATLFGIYIPFFARVSMSVIQYTLFYFLIRETAACFVKPQNAQYAMAGFLLFLLPEAYWSMLRAHQGMAIYSFDHWQFNNTPYYGGSVVRMSGIFALYHFSRPLLKKMEWKKFVWVGLVTWVLLGYSTTIIPLFALFAAGIILAKLAVLGAEYVQKKNYGKLILCIGAAAALAAGLWLLNEKLGAVVDDEYETFMFSLLNYQNVHFSGDLILLAAPWLLAGTLLFCRKKKQFAFVLLTAFLLVCVWDFPNNFLMGKLAFGYDFVVLRTVSAVQMIFYLLAGILVIRLLEFVPHSFAWAGTVSMAALVAVFGIYMGNLKSIAENDFMGSGVTRFGWDFSRILNFNSDMMPDPAREIGDYFYSLPYGTYKVLSPGLLPTGEKDAFVAENLLFCSNRIQLVSPRYGLDWDIDGENDIFQFLNTGAGGARAALKWINSEGIQYVLTYNPEVRSLLENAGCQTVLEANSQGREPIWLLKTAASK